MLETRALTTAEIFERLLPAYRDKDVIVFEEGLVGFPSAKRFILIESASLSPFRILKCVDDPQIGFLVLDPRSSRRMSVRYLWNPGVHWKSWINPISSPW
jgi:hypothetical protein